VSGRNEEESEARSRSGSCRGPRILRIAEPNEQAELRLREQRSRLRTVMKMVQNGLGSGVEE
jgi:hypothetical protein